LLITINMTSDEMSGSQNREETIFEAAAQLAVEQRATYLKAACGEDARLRQRIEMLLAAHERSSNFMEESAVLAGAKRELQPVLFSEKTGDKIGRYKLLQQIGEGGCGVVYMAEQEEPVRRRVALKVIKLGMDTKNVIARFEAERQALALMDHPNIAKVFDAGATETGRPFFVMELVHGTKITEFCDANKISTEQRLQLFVQVCLAIQHAHQKGVIHRDIKPSNIMVTLRDGVPVPKVIDFGIAKATTDQRLTDKTVFTAFEQFIGTPAYMSPEQAEMSELGIDTRSDIYSLGVLLYELLTGLTPFDSRQLRQAGLDEIRRIIREEEPPRPSTRLSTLAAADLTEIAKQRTAEPTKLPGLFRGELDWIVMKALEKDRNRRYATANGLAADVQHYLADEPVAACPPSNFYRLQKSVRRHKTAYFTAAVFFILLLAGVVASMSEAVRARRAELEQGRLRQQAVKVGETLRRNLYAAEMNMANQVLDLNNGIRRISSVVSKWEDGQPDLRGWEWYYLNSLCHRESLTLHGNDKKVNALAASPDGFRLAACYQDGILRIWDVFNGEELLTLRKGSRPINSVAWNPDGSRLAWSEGDKLVIWDVVAGKQAGVFAGATNGMTRMAAVAWSPDGKKLAVGGGPRTAQVWDAVTGKLLTVFDGHTNSITCIAWSPDGTRVVSGANDGTLWVWDSFSGRQLIGPLQHAGIVRGLSWSSDGEEIATCGIDSLAKIWDASTGKLLNAFSAHPVVVEAVAWKPNTRQLATVSNHDALVRLWDLTNTNRSLSALRGHLSALICLAWSPDGTWLASGGEDGEIKIWNPTARDALAKYDSIQASAVDWNPDGIRIATASVDGFITIFDAATETVLKKIMTPQTLSCVAWSGDGNRLATCIGGDGPISSSLDHPAEVVEAAHRLHPITIWDPKSGREILTLRGQLGAMDRVAWSPDSKRLVSSGRDGTAKVWDAETGDELLTIKGRAGQMLSVEWSPDGSRIATGSSQSPGIQIWNAVTGAELKAMKPAAVRCVSWSPDGARLASAQDDGTVIIWDAVNGKELLTFRGHTAGVLHVQWNPDGQRVLSVDRESLVKIWDPNDGREMLTVGRFVRAAWSHDGVRLACVSHSAPACLVVYDATLGYAASGSVKALPGLNRWLALHPDDLGYLRRRAEVLASAGDWDKSAKDYQRILSQAKGNATGWFETGWWISEWPGKDESPNLPPENELDPTRTTHQPSGGEISRMLWRPLSTEVENPFAPDATFETEYSAPHSITFVQKRIWTPRAVKLNLMVESAAPVRLWLNRQSISPTSLPLVTLKDGWNTLLVYGAGNGTNRMSMKFLPADR
jgi:eukaryotic-like serine/threonine-protein kinase